MEESIKNRCYKRLWSSQKSNGGWLWVVTLQYWTSDQRTLSRKSTYRGVRREFKEALKDRQGQSTMPCYTILFNSLQGRRRWVWVSWFSVFCVIWSDGPGGRKPKN